MSRLRFRSGRGGLRWRHGLLLWLFTGCLAGVTLEDLRRDVKLTPRSFARYFADFSYKFHEEIQTPEVFLATQNGDCDDYATLADLILREKGYTTRLMAVRMPGLTHVVCYVAETKCYLDFNNRTYLVRTVSSGGSLQDVARKVAKSFEANWTSASEFTYGNGVKRLVTTITKTQPYMASPVPVTNPPSPVRIDF
ncbi:MAG: transglutaminase domain-containing protein [Verrucomicrobiota bacterium]